MRLFAVLLIVVVLPFTGLRMVCLDDADSRDAGRTSQAQAAVGGPDGAACAHSCALHAKKAPRPACRLVAGDDDVCAFMIDGTAAVLQRGIDLPITLASAPIAFIPTVAAYPAPMLAPPGPPPKV